jgi:hypothetical protein
MFSHFYSITASKMLQQFCCHSNFLSLGRGYLLLFALGGKSPQ